MSLQTPKILVVDDEPDLELLINQRFRKDIKEGRYSFVFAGNGVVALQVLNEYPDIELVLTDINMPEMDGLTLLAKIKEMNNPLLHSVIVSAYGDILNIRTAMNGGAFDFIVKPIDLNDLEITIKKAIDNLETLKKALQARDKLIVVQNELQEARNLQLSMLPKELPLIPNIDFAVYMKTATEVGGDYYDFHVHPDGTVTIILGDATGHGMRAGMMVSIMKSLFMSDRNNMELKPFFENSSKVLKDMQLGRLMMALTCVQIKTDKIITTNAGMPPLFIYRAGSHTVDEVIINNMPLGAMKEIVYDLKEISIKHGDILLLMSDGFAELKNENVEIYGYKRTINSFLEVANNSPGQIINYLVEIGRVWTNGNEPEDDITFVVIKIK